MALNQSQEAVFDNIVLRSHPFVVQERQRSRRKRMKRLVVFGKAAQVTGTITFRCDGVREESYPVTESYDPDQGILIYQECSMAMTGFVPECEVALKAAGLQIEDTRLEMVVLD